MCGCELGVNTTGPVQTETQSYQIRTRVPSQNTFSLLPSCSAMPIDISTLQKAIKRAIPVTHLEIEDTSNGCGENYSVLIVSEAFVGKTTLARHRLVNELLKDQIAQMHAFSQKTFTPDQYSEQSATK